MSRNGCHSAGPGLHGVWRHSLLTVALGTLSTSEVAIGQTNAGQVQIPRLPDMDRPVFLSGQVVLEDGTPPPEQVLVQRVCDEGRPIPQGYTDARGQFSFEIGRNRSLAMDAQNATAADPFGSSASRGSPGFAQPNGPPLEGGMNPRDLTGCELRIQVPGFYPAARDLSGRRVMDSPDVGTLVLRRLPGVQGSIFSSTTLQARKEARAAFEKGRDLARGKELDDALKEYERAVRIAPRFAAAWFELGLVHQMLNHTADARKAYGEALLADPSFIKPYRQIALLSFNEQKWSEVVEVTDRWIGLDQVSYPEAHFFNAFANFYLNQLDAAERRAREVVKLDADRSIPRARYVLGAVLIERGDYVGAAEQLRKYVEVAEPGPDVERARQMLAQLEAKLGATPKNAP
jgi:tetratricopeptide (TPR) repeat protein